MRVLLAAEKTAIEASRVRMAYLVHFDFPSGPVLFTTNTHSLFFPGGSEWLGVGNLLDISLPQEDASLESHKCEIKLSGLNPALISLALNEDIENAPCTIYLALFDPDTNQPVGPAFVYHRGTVGQVRIMPPSSSE